MRSRLGHHNKLSLRAIALVTAASMTLAGLSGCAADGSVSKAGIGATIGAVSGAVIGNNTGDGDRKNRVIGAIVGGLAGGAVGAYMDKQQRDLEGQLAKELAANQVAITRLSKNVLQVNLDSNATFATGSHSLNPAFHDSLSKLGRSLAKNNQTVVHVVGHTDNVGSESSNQSLSERRAQSVARYLANSGVVTDRIRTRGLGESRPVASNESDDGRRLNRRVEIFLKAVVKGKEQEAFNPPY